MEIIDTSKKGWQKQMDAAMKSGQQFTLHTQNKILAESLQKGDLNVGVMKLILFGAGAAGAGAAGAGATGVAMGAASGATVVGLSGAAKLAAGSALFAMADPEPVTKIVLAIIATIAFILGCYFVYRLVKMLLQKKYKFTIRNSDVFGNKWEVVAEPV